MTTNLSAEAAKLKEQGNALFGKKDYNAAVAKYSRALKIADSDGGNESARSVLYANRAACYMGMKKYGEVVEDARKSVELDPTYGKGWARLANAESQLNHLDESIDAWEHAVSTLPSPVTSTLSPAEEKTREEYVGALERTREQRTAREKAAKEKAARAAQKAQDTLDRQERERENARQEREDMKESRRLERSPLVMRSSHSAVAGKGMPWDRAMAMYPELVATNNLPSSAWVMKAAYQDFEDAMEKLRQSKRLPNNQIWGHPLAFTMLSNALLRDGRVFHITDANFQDMFNQQVTFELTKHRGWAPADSAESMLHDAQARLPKEGWDGVRPSIAATVRVLYLQAFLVGPLAHDRPRQVSLFAKALEILDNGRTLWANVSKDDRGAVFEPTFIRGIRTAHLDALMELYAETPKRLREQSMLEMLLEEAHDVYNDADAIPPREQPAGEEFDPGFVSSFWQYPKAKALSMIGFYHNETAKNTIRENIAAGIPETKDPNAFPPSVKHHLEKAAESYLNAAELLPPDEESHPWFLNVALEYLIRSGAPLFITLPIMKRIRESIPLMKRIWEHSAMAQGGRDQVLQLTLDFEKEVRSQMQANTLVMESCVVPDYFAPLSKC